MTTAVKFFFAPALHMSRAAFFEAHEEARLAPSCASPSKGDELVVDPRFRHLVTGKLGEALRRRFNVLITSAGETVVTGQLWLLVDFDMEQHPPYEREAGPGDEARARKCGLSFCPGQKVHVIPYPTPVWKGEVVMQVRR